MRTVTSVIALAMALAVPAAARGVQHYKPGQDGVTSPVLVKNVHPQYTADAKARRVQGTVELAVTVNSDGTVADDVRVLKSLDEQLDQQAIIAVKQWKFRPGTYKGQPVAVIVNVELTFTLR